MCYCAASCFSAKVPPFLGTSLLCCTPEHSTKEPEQFSSLKKSDISIKHKKDGPTFAAQNINNGGVFHKNPQYVFQTTPLTLTPKKAISKKISEYSCLLIFQKQLCTRESFLTLVITHRNHLSKHVNESCANIAVLFRGQ